MLISLDLQNDVFVLINGAALIQIETWLNEEDVDFIFLVYVLRCGIGLHVSVVPILWTLNVFYSDRQFLRFEEVTDSLFQKRISSLILCNKSGTKWPFGKTTIFLIWLLICFRYASGLLFVHLVQTIFCW